MSPSSSCSCSSSSSSSSSKHAFLTHSPPTTTVYSLLPRTIPPISCRCTHLHNPPISAKACILIMLDRFDKLWSRLVHLTMTRKVFLAAERVIIHLRRSGIEFCHLVGREMGVEVTRGKRKEVSVLFLVPGRGEVGHRLAAEMIAHLNNGEEKGVQNVASRYWYDWEDWTVSQPWNYVKEDGKKEIKVDIPDKGEEVPWQNVMNRLAEVIESVGGCTLPRPEFDTRVQRVAEEIKMFGVRGYQFSVEKVWRQVTKRKSYPLVRLAVMARKGREEVRIPRAVMLLELGQKEGSARSHVQNFAVFYEGEWPVCHQYRSSIPLPTLEGLKQLLEG
ncbi:hypothetical protein J005_04202 [Cryptococcus neoformans]|nr:hypothetical protein C344_04099 [Cryptococcus neoformans var. grubii AD1-7a]OXH29696.1 hypothetical protein J005_04202 [Cryptococcus neoformans var. grubii]